MSDTRTSLAGASALVGAWVFVSAFVLGTAGAAFWNNLVVGAAIFVLAGYVAYERGDVSTTTTWAAGLAALLGLWLVAAPFVLGAATAGVQWSAVVSGVVVLAFAGYVAYDARGGAELDLPGRGTAQ